MPKQTEQVEYQCGHWVDRRIAYDNYTGLFLDHERTRRCKYCPKGQKPPEPVGSPPDYRIIRKGSARLWKELKKELNR